MMLYLWKISQDENSYYDTYDSAVVVAETEEEARKIHPSEYQDNTGHWPDRYGGDWATTGENVMVEKLCPLHDPPDHLKAGTVILASFNAG